MYKKQFVVQAQNLLSKKDVKTLKTQLGDYFPGLDEKTLDELLPEGQVKVLKLDNKSLLYQAGDVAPAFFDVEGKGELFPCLTTLWQHPYMMQELTIHAEVSKFVLNGADLMLPGVIVPANGIAGLGTVTKGQRRCIKIEGNPYPIAVGKMLVNQTQLEKLKGKGLEVLHVYKDALWAFAGKVVPNAGFSEKEDEVTACSDSSWSPGGEATSAPVPPTEPAASDAAGAAAAGGMPQAETPAAAAGSSEAVNSTTRGAAGWSQDDLLDFCFMQAFKVSLVDEKGFPVEASELYEKHMKPQRPEGTTLDVKKSSHKQIGKFLNAMRKAKVIEVVEKKGIISVTKVDTKHKVFTELEEKFADDATGAATAASTASAQDVSASAGLAPPKVSQVWKPTHYTEGLFKAMGKGKGDLQSWEEATAALRAWCEKESLMEADGVKLSEDLLVILYRAAGAQPKGLTFPEKVDFSELEEKLQERMQEHTTVDVAGVGPTTRKGPLLKIEVSLSRKGAHNVTRICNLEAYGLDVERIGDELKKKLNCTVHIEDMPGKNVKDKMMQLQGHVDQEFAEYLLTRYGITKSYMSVK